VTTLDVVRSSRFLGEIKNVDPKDIKVTVVGGHSGVTIVPLLSQTSQGKDVSGEQYKALVKRIQFGGDGEYRATSHSIAADLAQRSWLLRQGPVPLPSQWASVSPPLGFGDESQVNGTAGARFANSLIRAMNGETGVIEPTFVKSPLYVSEGVEYFASNVELGPEGVKKIHPVGSLSAAEEELVKGCLAE